MGPTISELQLEIEQLEQTLSKRKLQLRCKEHGHMYSSVEWNSNTELFERFVDLAQDEVQCLACSKKMKVVEP
jgi:hypothetical protein